MKIKNLQLMLLGSGLALLACANGSEPASSGGKGSECDDGHEVEGRPLDKVRSCFEDLRVAGCSSDSCDDGALSYARDPDGTVWQLSTTCRPDGWTKVDAREPSLIGRSACER